MDVALADVDRLVERDFRRNVTAFVLFEFVWGLGMPFAFFSSMVPAYLTTLGSSKSLIGFVQSFWTIATPLQLVSGYLFAGNLRVKNTMFLHMLGAFSWLTYSVLMIAFPGMLLHGVVLWGFVLAVMGFAVFITLAIPLYMGVITDNVPVRKRGKLYGFRTMALGAGGVIMGAVVSWVLKQWSNPLNYQVSFLIGNSLYFISCFSLFLAKDHRNPNHQISKVDPVTYVRENLGRLWENPNYRVFLFFHILNASATSIATFIIPYAKENLGISDSQFGYLAVIYLVVNACLGIFIGKLADLYGYKLVSLIQSVCLFIFFIIAIDANSFISVCIAYGFYSVTSMSLFLSFHNMSVELCPDISPTDISALGRTLLVPFIATVAPLCGGIIDISRTYVPVFVIGITLSVVAFIGIVFLVREPRTGNLYVMKQFPRR